MRLLFTFTGGSGHFLPAIPIARAAMARGHTVAFSAQETMLSTVEAAGFPAIGSGSHTLADPSLRGPLLPVDRAHEERVIREVCAGRTARQRAARLLDVYESWQPDVIVRDEVDFGAAVAAERLGLSHASIVVLAAGVLIRPDLVTEPLDALRTEHGLPADPQLEMLHRHLTLVPVPPSYRTPSDPLPATARHLHPAVLDSATMNARDDTSAIPALDWLQERSGRPTVYFTLGTVFHQESGDLFSRVVAGLSELDANIIVTVCCEIDPAELGNRPTNVRIDRFVPQGALLPHCDVVVSHAGSGSVIGALAFGVPLVLLPMGADQPLNADRCHALGVARVLDPLTVSSGDVRLAVVDVLRAPNYRDAATRIQNEIAHLPTSADAVRGFVCRHRRRSNRVKTVPARSPGQSGSWTASVPCSWSGICWPGPRRFGELRQSLPGISPKTLTDRLRDLEAGGLVTRTLYPQIPPRVDYQLTDRGTALLPLIAALADFGRSLPAPPEEQARGRPAR